MKYLNKILLTITISLVSISNVFAECTKEEINEFKKVEKEFKVTQTYDTQTKSNKIIIYNPNPQKYQLYTDLPDSAKCKREQNDLICTEVKIGEYIILIKARNQACEKVLKEIPITTKKMNKYYEDELCKGIEEFVLCQPYYEKEIDYDTFKKRTKIYKKNKLKESKEPPSESRENKIINYVKKKYNNYNNIWTFYSFNNCYTNYYNKTN